MSPPSLSQHLRLLKRAGLVSDRRRGRFRIYCLKTGKLKPVLEFLRQFDL